ncbi:MAG TPA: HAD family hydrolase [Candidatus Kaiserbacteria bacterium]|nr:HAD family hydrolase [Candidatus Kaiserbacteria bacterium]
MHISVSYWYTEMNMNQTLWHALSIAEVRARLSVDTQQGLSVKETQQRLAENGSNTITIPPADTLVTHIIREVVSPISLVLIFATGAAVLVGAFIDAAVIAPAFLINVVIGVFQGYRATRTFEALKKKEAKRASVVRDGQKKEIPAGDVVKGDVVLLLMGMAVPADVRIFESHSLSLSEMALTGEWAPVSKNPQPVDADAPLADRSNMAYAGTFIVSGSGRGIVVSVGDDTELGSIAQDIGTHMDTRTPLSRDISHAAWILLGIVSVAITIIFGLSIFDGLPFTQAAIVSIAVAIAAVPEGLPAAITVVLAVGMRRILAYGGLVKSLLSAETLGVTSVIVVDKTGTLTEGRMRVVEIATRQGETDDLSSVRAREVLKAAIIASDGYAEPVEDPSPAPEKLVAHGRPIEQAIILAAFTAEVSEPIVRKEFPRHDALPFNATRRFGGMLVKEGDGYMTYLSGAPEVFMEKEDSNSTLSLALHRAMYSGKRVIAVARHKMSEELFPADEEGISEIARHATIIGLITLSDSLRLNVPPAVSAMHDAGIRVLMATGDNPETALSIARSARIAPISEEVYTGSNLASMSDDELYQALMKRTVFARVTPADKLRIAEVLQNSGEVVAMTGDGVNDAPALRAAAIGIALGSGTDVAKEASDLILLKDDFSTITLAIREGRRLRDNIKKIFTYLIATNFIEVFLIMASLAGRMPLPLLPLQILWINLVEGGPMNMAFTFEPLYPSAMRRQPKDTENAHVLSPKMLKFIAGISISTGFLFTIIFVVLLRSGLPENEIRTVLFIATSLATLLTAFSFKSFGTPIWKISFSSNRMLLYALAGNILLLLVALGVPALSSVMGLTAIPLTDAWLILGAVVSTIFIVELYKYILYIRPEKKSIKMRVQV